MDLRTQNSDTTWLSQLLYQQLLQQLQEQQQQTSSQNQTNGPTAPKPIKSSKVSKRKHKTSKQKEISPGGKNNRKSFAVEQLLALECQYSKSKYLRGQRRSQLARELNLAEAQVKIW